MLKGTLRLQKAPILA